LYLRPSVTDDLITGYTTSGVKQNRKAIQGFVRNKRSRYRTVNPPRGRSSCKGMLRDSGGGLSRSSEETSVMDVERRA
jgi:hypothetical protein